jgi:hypothetical protein
MADWLRQVVLTEELLADIEYLESMVAQCRHGTALLVARAKLASPLLWSQEVTASLETARQTVSLSSSVFDGAILSAKQTLQRYIDKYQK